MSDWIPTVDQLEAITGSADLATLKESGGASVLYELADSAYRRSGGVNQSFLKLMDPMPGSAISFFHGGDKTQFRIGRYVHQGILTPHDPVPEFVVRPEKNESGKRWVASSNEAQLWEAKQVAAGLQVFSQDDYDEWSGCVRSLAANPEIRTWLAEGDAEVSCFTRLEVDGVEFIGKTRIDWVPPGVALLNFKTTLQGGSSPHKFRRDIRDHYGFQAAYELMIWNLCHPGDQRSEYVWPVVEKKPPYCIQFFHARWDDLHPYRERVRERLFVFAGSIREGVFRGDNPIYQRI